MNRITCLSINYRIAPVEIREKARFSPRDFQDLMHRNAEIYTLTTCNRTEVYWTDIEDGEIYMRTSDLSGVREGELREVSELFKGKEAVRHLFRVASGLDSLIIGETQILGQVKEAYKAALDAGSTSVFLNKALHRAFRTSKRIRTETDIGRYPVSVASEAVELACHIFGDINTSSVLVIGAGEMAGIAAQRLKDRGAKDLSIINRTLNAACELAEELGGMPKPFESLKEELTRCNIVISSTGSPVPIITKPMMDEVMKLRRHDPLIMIDIAVPRDIEPAVGSCYNCYLYDIDTLKTIVDRHATNRREEAEKAGSIISAEVDLFERWVNALNAQDTIRDLFSLIDEIVGDEVQQGVPEGIEAALIEQKLQSSLKRMLHRVVSFLKEHPSLANIENTRRIFQLDANYQDRHKG